MPSRNTLKVDVAESYYHVYARGASKQPIFLDQADFEFFIDLFARYLSAEVVISKNGEPYPHLTGSIELLAFCLMENHFHMLLYQIEKGAMTQLMRSIMTSYSRYFNRKYQRTGSLFESRYKASVIQSEVYLQHISRYIHLNPRSWRRYPFSSYKHYHKGEVPEWLTIGRVLELFDSRQDYSAFVADYQAQKRLLDELKREMANG